jgi:hypothetical protein
MAMIAGAALSSCGGPDEPAGLKKSDLSSVPSAVASRIDRTVIETRRINGTWKGKLDKDDVEAQFGGDGTLSIQMLRDGSMVDAARGSYAWTPDGHLKGTTEGATAGLSPYASWTAGFPDAGTMLVSGDGGTMRLVRRRGFAPTAPGSAR